MEYVKPDDDVLLDEIVNEKIAQASEPGNIVYLDPVEADHLGLVPDDTMSDEEAWDSRLDEDPYGSADEQEMPETVSNA